MNPDEPRCQGIAWHKDTVWKRCPKADTCERYLTRRDAGPMTPVVRTYCQTPEFEHYREAQ
jgi:hypothetical protein